MLERLFSKLVDYLQKALDWIDKNIFQGKPEDMDRKPTASNPDNIHEDNTIHQELEDSDDVFETSQDKYLQGKLFPAPADSDGQDPLYSKPDGKLTTFLWKPSSDHASSVALVVSSDEIRANDLRVEVFNRRNNKILATNHMPHTAYHKRANKLGKDKYGRVSFRLNRSDDWFYNNRGKPKKLGVRFYHEFLGEKIYIEVTGKDFIEINDSKKRLEINL